MKTQPDDKSTFMTRAVGNVTGWFGSFPAIIIAVAVYQASAAETTRTQPPHVSRVLEPIR